MEGCIFGVGYLLWLAIKGIFKLFWIIISFPFKTIKNSQDKKRREIEILRQEHEKRRSIEDDKQVVDDLYQKIVHDVFSKDANYWPNKIIVYKSTLNLFYSDGTKKELSYVNYGAANLKMYDSYWCTDGTESGFKVNQELLLAKQLNAYANDSYFVNDKINKTTSIMRNDVTMHHYIQQYVEMSRKD